MINIKLKKTILVVLDTIFIMATVVPVLVLLKECIEAAIVGTIPWGFGYGVDYGEKIFGIEAFFYVMSFYLAFFFVLVALWAMLYVFTSFFTVFTLVYLKK